MYCTKCGNQVDDSAAFCTKCGAPMNGKQPTANEAVLSGSGSDDPRRPKIPGITLAACIILYVSFALGMLSTLSGAGNMPAALVASSIGWALLGVACTICAQKGRNWARIALTVFIGLALIVTMGLAFVLILPLVFLWLPRSNNWYRAIKSLNK